MAHECPECGEVCHCNGDIDDLIFERGSYICNHWKKCDREELDEDDPIYFEKE